MYGNYFTGPMFPYNQMLNTTIPLTRAAPLARSVARPGILSSLLGRNALTPTKINWSSLLNNTSKTIGVVKEAIPIVKEVGPMMNNMRSMLKIASVFKDETDKTPKEEIKKESNKTTTSQQTSNQTYNEPNFFL